MPEMIDANQQPASVVPEGKPHIRLHCGLEPSTWSFRLRLSRDGPAYTPGALYASCAHAIAGAFDLLLALDMAATAMPPPGRDQRGRADCSVHSVARESEGPVARSRFASSDAWRDVE